MRGWLGIVVVGALAGCKPHVKLVPPPATATLTPEQRIATFNQLHGVRELTTTTVRTNCTGDCILDVDKVLYLANGTQIHHVEDLLPLLPADSESAKAIRAAGRARTNGRIWTIFTSVLLIAAAVIDEQTDGHRVEVMLSASVAALVGGILIKRSYTEVADQEGRANRTFNEGLAEELYLCVSAMELVPCEELPMPGTRAPNPSPPQEPPAHGPLPPGALTMRTF